MTGLGFIIIVSILIVSFGLTCLFHKNDVYVQSLGDKILATVAYGMGIFVIMTIIICICSSMQEPVINSYNEKYELVAFNNISEQNSKLNGNFVLGCGSINGISTKEQYYYFLRKTVDNNIEFKKINIFNNSYKVYLKTIPNNIVPYVQYSFNEYVYINRFNEIFSNKDPRKYDYTLSNVTFFIPENSIRYDISFDINNF